MSRVEQGAIVTLTVTFTADAADVSLTMLTPAGTVYAGFPVVLPAVSHGATGVYYYAWTCPGAAPVGDYLALWTATVGATVTVRTETVEVHAVEAAGLTVADLRLYVTSALTDAALQLLLDAADDEIEDVAPSGSVDELLSPGHGDLLMLSRPAESITSVVEGHYGAEVTLATDDYEIRSSRQTLRRLRTGTNPAYHWRGRVDVTYVPEPDADQRKRVQLALVQLDLNSQPGVQSETIGTWSQTLATGKPYAEARAEILATLTGGTVMVV